MPGQLKARRPRRGGRGRRRRSGARNKTNHQAEDGPPPAADDPAAEQEPRESFPARIEPERAPAVAAREREGAPPGDGGALDDVPPLTSPSLPGERRAPRRPSARRRSPAADRGGRRGGARTGIRSVPAPLGGLERGDYRRCA
ncbi:MAG: hypothetical protein ACE5HU_02425, partial [Acidobacteriota bacterium]